jgi:hypothetical protein
LVEQRAAAVARCGVGCSTPLGGTAVRTTLVVSLLVAALVASALQSEVEDNDTLAEATQITAPGAFLADEFPPGGVLIRGELTPGDVDYYAFGVRQGEVLTVSVMEELPGGPAAPGEFHDPQVGVFRPDPPPMPAPFVTNDDGGPGFLARLALLVDETGTWSLAVTGFGDDDFDGAGHVESFRYRLVVAAVTDPPTFPESDPPDGSGGPNDDPASPDPIPSESGLPVRGVAVVSGSLTPADVDHFSLRVRKGDVVTASVFEEAGDELNAEGEFNDSILEVLGDDGSLVDSDDDGGPGFLSNLTLVADDAGVHDLVLAVSGFEPGSDVGAGHREDFDYELVVSVEGGRQASIDIKPGACPNPWNRQGRGVLTVAVVGTEDLDVTQIDASSVVIARADGLGGSLAPNEGPPGPQSTVKDIATPFEATQTCECEHLGADGIVDLSLSFRTDDLVETLYLGELSEGAMPELIVSGTLLDGTPFEGRDCVQLVPPGTPPQMLAVQSTAADAWIDVAPLDDQIDGGGFASFERTYPQGTEAVVTASPSHAERLFRGWRGDDGRLIPGRTIALVVDGHIQTLEAVYEAPRRRCGLGFELTLLLVPLLWLHRRRRPIRP